MSLDYYLWRGPKLTAQEFRERLMDLDEGRVDEANVFSRTGRLQRFRHEVLRKYPSLEEDSAPDSPWATTPVASAYFIELNLKSSIDRARLKWIVGRALYNGLYIYDPQGDEVFAPGPARWQIYLRKIGLGRLAGPDP